MKRFAPIILLAVHALELDDPAAWNDGRLRVRIEAAKKVTDIYYVKVFHR